MSKLIYGKDSLQYIGRKMSLLYDYSRCNPKWPYLCCETCARHVESNEDFPSNRPMTVSDFSTDTKGDQLQECGMYIEDRLNEEDKP